MKNAKGNHWESEKQGRKAWIDSIFCPLTEYQRPRHLKKQIFPLFKTGTKLTRGYMKRNGRPVTVKAYEDEQRHISRWLSLTPPLFGVALTPLSSLLNSTNQFTIEFSSTWPFFLHGWPENVFKESTRSIKEGFRKLQKDSVGDHINQNGVCTGEVLKVRFQKGLLAMAPKTSRLIQTGFTLHVLEQEDTYVYQTLNKGKVIRQAQGRIQDFS